MKRRLPLSYNARTTDASRGGCFHAGMTLVEITGTIPAMAKTVVSELAQFGLIEFTGPDAQGFLHNQLTCDVANLAVGRSTYGAYCTPKGRALASFLLWRTAERFYMMLPAALCDSTHKLLSKYILRAKVKAADVSQSWRLIGASGAEAHAVSASAAGEAPPGINEVAESLDAMVVRLADDRHLIAARPDKAQLLLASAHQKTGPEYWDWLQIRAGVPTILPATQEAFVPQMLNLDALGGVSLSKGCYPGQEIVARMHYRGTLKQRMVLAKLASAELAQPDDKLYSPAFGEQACGTVVNAARSPEGGCDLLAVLQIAAAEKGDIHWKSAGGPRLSLLPLPYALPAAG